MEKHTLIITEKPDAAQQIAKALDQEGKPEKMEENGVPYFLAQRNRKLVVVPALGHLYTVVNEWGRRNYYPVFSFKWAPRYLAERGAKRTRAWIETISKLASDAEEFVNACDYDLEGSLIGYCILKYACEKKERAAKRMKFSTLMKSELEKAYEEPLSQLDFANIEAAKTRHETDWLYGVNLSRALTLAARRWSGVYSTLSTGRVQGPTLKFLSEREKAIRSFVPTPYWEIRAEVEIKNFIYEAEYERRRIEKRTEAEAIVRACTARNGEIKKVETKTFQQKPNIPFNIGGLQTEAYNLFGYNPRRTLDIAQRLYIEALISYPRTNSQKLPTTINCKNILKSLSRETAYKELALELLKKKELEPREGAKKDSAHPAIFPTGNLPKKFLSEPEKRLWDLVVKRFMAIFGETAVRQSVRAGLEVNGHNFFLRSRKILKEGWMRFYRPYVKAEEMLLPPITKGESVRLKRVIRVDKFVNPPPRYNPSSLLRRMEELGIGTKATRADIIETLYSRRYIVEERIMVTDLGFDIINILNKYAPGVISVKLTQELERKMEKIQSNREKRENILLDAVEQLKLQLEHFKEKEEQIGEMLSNAINRARVQERIVGNCPVCGTGNLIILYSRKTKKRFVGCSNYFKGICKTSFPLPQRGTAKPMRKDCPSCGWPMVQAQWGRNPWSLCFNPNCPLKEGRRKRAEMQSLQQRSP